jgi:hypothetical protein
MNTIKRFLIVVFVTVSTALLLLSGGARGEQDHGPVTHSTGKVFVVDSVGHYVMIQKADGKKVSLELTPETEVTLDGKVLPLDQLDVLEKGFAASADHFTNDAGMQRTLKLTVQRGAAQ